MVEWLVTLESGVKVSIMANSAEEAKAKIEQSSSYFSQVIKVERRTL